jgi:hypothetical protein
VSSRSASLVLAFSDAAYFRTPDCYHTLRGMFPAVHIVGCSSSGSICDTHISDSDVVVTAVNLQNGHVRLVSAEAASGEDLQVLAATLMKKLVATARAGCDLAGRFHSRC